MRKDRLVSKYGNLAVVTGATDGIGRAFAEKLAEAGLNLILVARREAELKRVAGALSEKYGVNAEAMPIDLSIPTAASRVLEALRKREIGILVAAAGFGTSGSFISNSIDVELQMIDVNCRAVVELAHGIGNGMAERKR
ncbi:MAG: SDR family NAD(P)-dependent oxidoreductase, partial [Rhizobiales bacterium]|nr:SDR family NAD(P)-dependent oxidoreductase [Hyphomicrobiales bacterium]